MTYRNDIDGLRAIAVLLVILSHVHLLPGGYIGVDIFFVISGFLIAPRVLSDIQAGTFSTKNFYTRRAKRLLPQVYLLILVCFALTYLLFLPSDFIAFSKSAIATVFYGSNFYFLSQAGYFAPDAITQPLLHTWSLAVEEQFYFVIPIVIYILSKLGVPILGLIVIGIASFTISAVTTPIWTDTNFYMLPFRVWEFIIGALIAYAPYAPRKIRDVAALLGVAIIGWSVFSLNETSVFPGINALPVVIGTALIIWSGSATFLAKTLATYPMRITGRASYSLYIWHWPIIVFYAYYSFNDFSPIAQIIMIIATFIVGFLLWYVWEEPIRKSKALLPATFMSTIAVSMTLTIASLVFIITNGMPSRLNEEARIMAETTDEKSEFLSNCIFPINPESISDDAHKLCTLGVAHERPSFALWGDSFAAAMAYGLSLEAEKQGRSGVLLSVNSCPPLIGADSWWEGTKGACLRSNENAIKAFKELGIKTVYMHASWVAFNNAEYVKSFPHSSGSGEDDTQAAINNMVKNTISELQQNGITPVFVEGIPTFGGNIVQQLTQKIQTGSSINLAKPMKILEEELTRYKIAVDSLSDVQNLKPSQILCGTDSCPASYNGKGVTYDGGHLSMTGSKALGALFAESLKTLN